ncbi:hypothetical protein L3X38_012616 [Prunus dulcis]|uniref:Uncharacterized protein n=1 Tax=Prunus dulcis TaxID=3755 RepID=A0AAD4ZG81_PRUDU|nr:hypothetical protein L3X38_012616 [Prunus dulcis]
MAAASSGDLGTTNIGWCYGQLEHASQLARADKKQRNNGAATTPAANSDSNHDRSVPSSRLASQHSQFAQSQRQPAVLGSEPKKKTPATTMVVISRRQPIGPRQLVLTHEEKSKKKKKGITYLGKLLSSTSSTLLQDLSHKLESRERQVSNLKMSEEKPCIYGSWVYLTYKESQAYSNWEPNSKKKSKAYSNWEPNLQKDLNLQK